MIEEHQVMLITRHNSHFPPLDDWMFSPNLDDKNPVVDPGGVADEVIRNFVETVISHINHVFRLVTPR